MEGSAAAGDFTEKGSVEGSGIRPAHAKHHMSDSRRGVNRVAIA
jgi:hypothetical protein